MSSVDVSKIHQLQIIIDESDPFLLEVLEQKTPEELVKYYEKFLAEYEVMRRLPSKTKQFSDIHRTITAYMELKKLMKIRKEIEEDPDAERGGVSIA